MKLDQCIEKVHDGRNVRYRQLADNDPEGALEMFENASVNNAYGRIEIDSSAAADLYQDDTDPIDYLESAIRKLDFADQYGAGNNSAHKKATETGLRHNNSDLIDIAFDKVERNDKLAKIADYLTAGSGLGFLGSTALGSVNGMGASATGGILSSAASARCQGGRDRWVEEAVEGLEEAYGNYRIEIV